jgi:hypothetical protein
MSGNKFKYFVVTTTSIVKAPNKAHAEKTATSARTSKSSSHGEMIYRDVDIERVTAIEAQSILSA